VILKILTRNKKAFAKYLFACTFFVTEVMFFNYVIARITGVAQTKDVRELWFCAALGIAALIYSAVIFMTSRFMRLSFMRDTILYIREMAFASILSKNYRSFGRKLKTEYISNLVNDINTFENQFFFSLLNVINNFAIYVVAVIILLILDPLLGIVLFVISWVVYGYNHLFQKRTVRMQEQVQQYNEDFTVNVSNTFSGLEILKLNRIEERFLKNSLKEIGKLERKKYHFFMFTYWQGKSMEFFGTVFMLALIYYVTGLFSSGYSLTRIMFIIQLSNFVIFPVTQISPLMNTVKANSVIVENMIGGDEHPSADDVKNDTGLPFYFEDRIEIKDLCFSHDDRIILNGIDLIIEKGKKYLVRGPSGAGKSTFVSVLSRVYDDYEGKILVDGTDLKMISEEDFNSSAAFIYQDVFLFEDSLRANISLYKDICDDDIIKAANCAGLDVFLSRMQGGLDTLIEENGKNLSGGERQRIAIARAIVRDPALLFADEITSALDEKLGRRVEETMLGLETTVISVSHKFYRGVSDRYDAVIEVSAGSAKVVPMAEYLQEAVI